MISLASEEKSVSYIFGMAPFQEESPPGAVLSPANLELNLYLPLAFWGEPHLICVHKMFCTQQSHLKGECDEYIIPTLPETNSKIPQNRPLENLETGISRVKLLVFRECPHHPQVPTTTSTASAVRVAPACRVEP